MVPFEIQSNKAIRQKPREKLPFGWIFTGAVAFEDLLLHSKFYMLLVMKILLTLIWLMWCHFFWQFWVNFWGECPRIYLYMRAFYVYLPILYYFSALDLVWAVIDFEIESSAIDAIYFNFFINHPSVLFTQSGHPKFAHHDSDC